MRRFLTILVLSSAVAAHCQQEPTSEPPLPDPATLLREVEVNQRRFEAVEKDYIFREDSTFDEVKGDGSPKKTAERAFDIFWISGVRLARLVRKDGKDLTPDEVKKEDERIDKEVAKAREKRAKADAAGKETDSHGRDEITLARILELGTFSNPHRVEVAGRPTIVLDYTGNPEVKTHNAGEAIFKSLSGTVAVDEKDRAVQHIDAHFTRDDKIGGGLVAEVKAGTSFALTNAHVNGEVWLPDHAEAQGRARYLLFFSLNGSLHIQSSNYRKFKTTSTILPGFQKAPEETPLATPIPKPDGPGE